MLLGFLDTPEGSQDGTIAATVAAATVSASGFASSDPDATLSISDKKAQSTDFWPNIPGYQIVGELGEGGGGKVYKALQIKADKRVVAIKVLHGNSKVERERLAREAKSLGRLSHPNIVTVYEVGDSPDGPYFTMEYMAGGSLAERIKKNRPTPMESAKIVEAVSGGVAAAHAAGILHRDLKPSNVLLAEDGTPKVADFGLAKFADGPADASTLEKMTPTGAILGTPAYMAPEQAAGRTSEIDERTDVYGLGAVLYHCLTGRAPFSGTTHVETVHRVLMEEVIEPRRIEPKIHPDCQAVCLKCLEKDASVRYLTIGELQAELARIGNQVPTVTRPPGLRKLFVRRLARNRIGIAKAAVVSVVAGLFVVMALARRPSEDESQKALKRLETELKGDQPVVLIDDKGACKWSRWNTGAVPFADSPRHDGALSFQALTTSRLELVPQELLPPEFILEFDVRHDSDEKAPSEVGAYFNHQMWVETSQYRATSLYTVGFNDYEQPQGPFKEKPPRQILCSGWAFLEQEEKYDRPPNIPVASFKIQPPPNGPRKWRTIHLEARKDSMKLSSRVDGRLVGFNPLAVSLTRLDKVSRTLSKMVSSELFPEDKEKWPEWGPKGSIGIFVKQGQGSFRNVVLTRISNPDS